MHKVRSDFDTILEAAPAIPPGVVRTYLKATRKVDNLAIPEIASVGTFYSEIFASWHSDFQDGAMEMEEDEEANDGCPPSRCCAGTPSTKSKSRKY